MTFGAFVKQWRKASGITLEGLAKKLGTHKGYISGWENEIVSPPSPKLVKKLASAMGVEERRLLLMAYAEKAPALIRDEVMAKLVG